MPKGDTWVYFALTPKDYQNLSSNLADTIRWVKETSYLMERYRAMAGSVPK